MRKSFGALLCATALVGAMSSGKAFADDLTVSDTQTIEGGTYDSITVNTGYTLTNSGALTSNGELSNSGAINNSSSITTQSISNAAGATITGVADSTGTGSINYGNLTITGSDTNPNTSYNYGTITQQDVTIGTSNDSSFAFTNTGTITSNGTFTNYSTITGNGNDNDNGTLNINTGTNSGSITQSIISITGETFTNTGTITASNTFTNSSTLSGSGTLNISGGTNNASSSIVQNIINLTGDYTNNGSMTANSSFTNSEGSVLTNTGTISTNCSFSNSGTISSDSEGTLNINADGTNSGDITQNSISIADGVTLNHSGSIVTDTINNSGTIAGNEGSYGSLTLKNGTSTNTSSITVKSFTNESYSTLNHSGSIVTDTITNSGTIAGNEGSYGSLTLKNGTSTNTGSISVSSFTNESTSTLTGDNGSLTLTGNSSNEGTITQTTIAVTSGIFTNTGSVTATTFDNSAAVSGTGTLAIFGGTNNGCITQNSITISGTSFTNTAAITADSFTNSATITGDNGTITAASGSNSGSITQKSFTVVAGSNGDSFSNTETGSIIANKVSNSGSFTNSGSIGTTEKKVTEFTNSGTFTNDTNGSIVATTITNNSDATFTNNSDKVTVDTFNNSGTVDGTGSLKLGSGTNTGSITQNSITITSGGTYNNGNSEVTSATINVESLVIEADGTLNNYGSIGDNDFAVTSITNNGTFSNSGTGSIYATTITNNTNASFTTTNNNVYVTTFNNYGTYSGSGTTEVEGGSNDASSTMEDNEITIIGEFKNNGTIIANESFTSGEYAKITGSGSIETAGGSNSGSITQNSIAIKGDFENNGSIATNEFENSGSITYTNYESNAASITINNSGTNTGSIIQKEITIADDGTLTSQGNDSGQASITVDYLSNSGTITLDKSILKVVTGDVTSGTINAIGTGNELNASITGGYLNIGIDDTTGTLIQTGGSVAADAIVSIASGSTYDIKNGSVTINAGDSWDGTITITGGTLTTDGFSNNGLLDADSGLLNITNSSVIDIGNGSSIAADVTTKIEEGSTLNINNGGSVELDSSDTWEGKIILGGDSSTDDTSSLTVNAINNSGTLEGKSGYLIVNDGGDINISTGSYIKNEVIIKTDGDINISGYGEVGIDDNDILGTGSVINLTENGILNYGYSKVENQTFKIVADAGNLNLLSGSKLTIDSSSEIKDAVALDIRNGATLTLEEATLTLTNADQWDGAIVNNKGTINADGLINDSETASLNQTGGTLNIYNGAELTLGDGSSISGGEINIYTGEDEGSSGSTFILTDGTIEGGDMTIDENSAFIVKNGSFTLNSLTGAGEVDEEGVMHAALVDVMNGQITENTLGTVTITGQTNFNIDIYARDNNNTSNDQFVVTSFTGDGVARIDNWSLNGDIFGYDAPIDRHIVLDAIFVDENNNPLEGNIEITEKTQLTPIGYYQLNQNGSGSGLYYTLDLVKFNPQVFRGQVATVAQWMNQLSIDDMLFTHSMVLPSFKEEDGGTAYSGIMANRYAASNPLFAPYQYSRKDGGLWYKMYGTFENLQMNQSGLGRVGNNAYGALIGADFGLKELKNGWKFMPTAYVGYNGAHQAYTGIGAYQNGGQAGFLGTWYKKNFIAAGLVYGGIYENYMDVGGHTDNAFNYFAGAATKFAYNWRFHRDWVLQPNLMAAYNFFGQQNWHSDYGQMGMMAGMLNGVNVAPGVNLIWEKDTFSIYGTLQYMYNCNGAVGGRAGNVGLPQVEMERGYIQYGIGFNKRWGDRFSGYLQAVLRNVGRTGAGFQLGFNFLLGK